MNSCMRRVFSCVVFLFFLAVPISVFAYGDGGGDSGGGSSGGSSGGGSGPGDGMTVPGMIFFEPEEGNLETEGGEIIMNDCPEPGQPFISQIGIWEIAKDMSQEQREEIAQITRDNAEHWDTAVKVAEAANKVGKLVEKGLAFTPVGVGTQTAISAARGAAEGGPKGAATSALVNVATSKLPPAVGIVAGKALENGVPVPSVTPPIGGSAPTAPPSPTGGTGPAPAEESIRPQ